MAVKGLRNHGRLHSSAFCTKALPVLCDRISPTFTRAERGPTRFRMIKIDPEFQNAIPPLSEAELATLTESLKTEGCREPLITWDGILIDGHNRYAICTEHAIPYTTAEHPFVDREAALDWIDANQLGRRNLTPDAFKLLLGRRYNRVKNNRGGDHGNQYVAKDQIDTLPTADRLAVEYGVSPATVKRAGKFAKEVEKDPILKQAIAEKKPVVQIKRELKEQHREQRRTENRALIQGVEDPAMSAAKFSTILVDPPWDWGDEGDVDQMGRARPTYGTMSLEQLLELPVSDLADHDCHLYLWITNRSLPKGFALLEKWGFRYITMLTWCKPSFGMGNYFRGQTEQILFGVKGSQPLKRNDVGTFFNAPRGPNGHSSKPLEAYDLIESCSPGPYLEMFARSHRKDWTPWGADA